MDAAPDSTTDSRQPDEAAALRQTPREMASLVENAPDIIVRFDRQLRHLFVNRAVETATGRPREDFIGKTNEELGMPAQQCAIWREAIKGVFATGKPTEMNFSFPTPEGERYFSGRIVPEFDDDGEPCSALCFTRDVTERMAVEAEVAHQRELLQKIFDSAPILLDMWNPQLQRFTLNRCA